ncbi:MAG: methionine--tRNA ligase [Nitrososphaeria archaeon]|nr:methionine--tRNA ligase [Nitrososphaeria archaeon]
MALARWLVTSAWPYSSVTPHLGNMIGSILSGDAFARYLRLKGHEVLYVSGSDEHGTPVEVEALKAGLSVKEFADRNHKRIKALFEHWNISYDNYTRTENPVHIRFVQEFYLKLQKNGYIYESSERVHYCEKDNRFLPDRFVEGECPYCGFKTARGDQCDGCGRPLEPELLINPVCVICHSPVYLKETRQWFFDLPKLSEKIKDYLLRDDIHLSDIARSFSIKLVEEGLKARSLTRDSKWGIPAPFEGAEGKTIYVWMEAVLGYVSATIEYFEKMGDVDGWKSFWFDKDTKTVYFIGKDNIPFHTIILPALLIGTGEDYNLPYAVDSTDFLMFEGQKFSKSRRIGIWIDEALEIAPADYWRYVLLSLRPEGGDVNFKIDLFIEKVNNDLNNVIGNLINRTVVGFEKFCGGKFECKPQVGADCENFILDAIKRHDEIGLLYEDFKIQRAVRETVRQAEEGNRFLNEKEPWKLFKEDSSKAVSVIYSLLRAIRLLTVELYPIMPSISELLWKNFAEDKDILSTGWDGAKSDFKYPIVIKRFPPVFKKISREEVLSTLERFRSGGGS